MSGCECNLPSKFLILVLGYLRVRVRVRQFGWDLVVIYPELHHSSLHGIMLALGASDMREPKRGPC